jgi:hypothetical protein
MSQFIFDNYVLQYYSHAITVAAKHKAPTVGLLDASSTEEHGSNPDQCMPFYVELPVYVQDSRRAGQQLKCSYRMSETFTLSEIILN